MRRSAPSPSTLVLLTSLAALLACSPESAPTPAAAPTASAGTAAAAAPSEAKPLTVPGLAAEPDVVLLDVRTPGEFAAGHVQGAINVPVGNTAGMVEVLGRKDRPVIVYCAVGARAGQAVSALRAQGFTRLINGGGFQAVARATGKPIVQ